MARYHFHRRAGKPEYDIACVECEDAQAARLAAIIFTGETLKEQPELVWCGHSLLVDVVDDGGTTIYTLMITPIERPTAPLLSRDAMDA